MYEQNLVKTGCIHTRGFADFLINSITQIIATKLLMTSCMMNVNIKISNLQTLTKS